MSTKKIAAINGLGGATDFNVQPGKVKQLLVTVEGTNKTGQTADVSSLGNFIVTRRGQQQQNRFAEHYANMNDLYLGKAQTESADAGSFKTAFIIPFYMPKLEQAYNVRDSEEIVIEYQPTAGGKTPGTELADLTITVEQEMADLDEMYQFKFTGNDINFSAAVQAVPKPIEHRNIVMLMLQNPDNVLESFQLEQNENTVVSPTTFYSLLNRTTFANRIESNGFKYAAVETFTANAPSPARVKGSTVNSKTLGTFSTSGAGKVGISVASIRWNGAQGNRGR